MMGTKPKEIIAIKKIAFFLFTTTTTKREFLHTTRTTAFDLSFAREQ
jgi:hypothetical protein